MTKINVYNFEAERIDEMSDLFDCSQASIVEALYSLLESEARLLNKKSEELLVEYL